MSANDSKSALRKKFLETRKALTPAQVSEYSRAIRQRLESLQEFRKVRAILSYVSGRDNEVDTQDIIKGLLSRVRCIYVPIADTSTQLSWSRIYSLEELAPGRFDILEPLPQHRRVSSNLDDTTVLVPGIVFSKDGYRIGYGQGYFDRFLATYNGCKIGLAYEVQIVEALPVEKHDLPLDMIVTDNAIYSR